MTAAGAVDNPLANLPVTRIEHDVRITISKAQLMRLQKGDIVVMRVKRPIASNERDAVIEAWKNLMAKMGIEGVELMLVAGAEVDISVMRQDRF